MISRWYLGVAGVLTLLAAVTWIYWSGRHDGAARERPKTEAARAEAVVSRLETQGARETVQRVEVVVRQREAAAASAAHLTQQALRAEDADAALDENRARRLRAHDVELCDAAPDLAGCAPDRDADGGDPLL